MELTVEEAMLLAIAQGEKGRNSAPPNPWVGAVLLSKNNQVIGEGFHSAPGQPHAEITALQNAMERGFSHQIAGSQCIVTLEPCSHHGRTGPCVDTLIQNKISHVFYAIVDPDPQVSGKGLKRLNEAGITTSPFPPALVNLAQESLHPYLHQRTFGLPFVTIKVATTLDGISYSRDRARTTLTDSIVQREVHGLRASSQAILIGVQTLLSDLPLLDRRFSTPSLDQPLLRIIIDPSGRSSQLIGKWNFFHAPTLIVTALEKTSPMTYAQFSSHGVEYLSLPYEELLTVEPLLKVLSHRFKIVQLFVEGGATTINHFIRNHLANRIILYQSPKIAGNTQGLWTGDLGVEQLIDAWTGEIEEVKKVGSCCKIVWKPHNQKYFY